MLDIYPNPTYDIINIEYITPIKDDVSIQVVDNLGKTIASIQEKQLEKGFHKISFNTTNYKSGTYAVKISYRDKSDVKVFIKQ